MVSIIVPVFNRCDLTAAAIAAVRTNTEADTYEIILVDNGSTDDTALLYPTVEKRIVLDKNLGFARACNLGAGVAGDDVLVFLNNDTEVHADWLPPLVAPLTDPTVGMTGARLLYPDGHIQHAGISFRMKNGELEAWNIRTELPTRDVEGVTGACLAMRAETFDEVAGFDVSYFNGYDDVDLCLKVRAAGYRIRYVAESTVTHLESASGPERWVACADNVARLQQKWRGHPVLQTS